MIRSKGSPGINSPPLPDSTPALLKALELIKPLIEKIKPKALPGQEDLNDTITTLLSNPAQQTQKKRMESTLFAAIEVIKSSFDNKPRGSNTEMRLVEELNILSKLLERCYIYSTDIEYAQFYNKELALRVDSVLSETQKTASPDTIDGPSLHSRVDQIFAEIESRKVTYFRFDN